MPPGLDILQWLNPPSTVPHYCRFPTPPDPRQCLVFEDAPNGVEAGLAAGMQVVMVPHHKVTKEFRLAATQVLATLEHFDPQDFGLPPF